MDAYDIEEIALPAGPASPGWDDFAHLVAVRNAVEIDGYGTPEVADPPEELLVAWNDPEEPKRLFVVRDAGRVIAYSIFETRAGEDADTAWLDLRVHPEFQHRGIGRMLADHLERVAAEAGMVRGIFYGVAAIGDGRGERLVPGTGAGSLPRDDRGVRFLLARGWTLEQVNRASRLALPLDPDDLFRRSREATAASGPDYLVHEWIVPTPERWREDLALLYTRMSTDAPQGDLEEPLDEWTVARVEEREAAYAKDAPGDLLTAAVEHVPTGRLAGFTQLRVPHEPGSVVSQWDTIVLKEHRGHRLGMLLKLANLEHLERVSPGHASVLTWNAEENRHMLDVNEAVGFVPIGYEGAWKKPLLPGSS